MSPARAMLSRLYPLGRRGKSSQTLVFYALCSAAQRWSFLAVIVTQITPGLFRDLPKMVVVALSPDMGSGFPSGTLEGRPGKD